MDANARSEDDIMQFMGMDGFIWFQGVVEDRKDPHCLGRVRVRIAGLHTDNKVQGIDKGIPTGDLPWAHPIQPITSAAMNGIGQTPLGPVEGTWVVGFFRDGKEMQEPVIFGTLGGIPLEPAGVNGFNDPNMVYPKTDFLAEPDTNRRAYESFEDPVVGAPIDAKSTPQADREDDLAVPVASPGTVINLPWNEPENPHAAVYPFNHVRESESGHMEEWDDTPGEERTMRWHKAGTFEETRADGTTVKKVVMDNYTIIMNDDSAHIMGNCNVTIDGDCNLKVGGNYNVQVAGDWNVEVTGSWNVDVLSNTAISTVGTKNDESGGIHTIKGSIIHLNP